MAGNIAQLCSRGICRGPQHVLYRHFVDDAWRDVTVAEVAALARRWQAAFRRDGFAAGDRIAVCMRNGVNWVAIDLAALGMGLVVVPLYVDDNAENIAWCVANAQARLLVVENSRIAAGLRKCAGTQEPLPPLSYCVRTTAKPRSRRRRSCRTRWRNWSCSTCPTTR